MTQIQLALTWLRAYVHATRTSSGERGRGEVGASIVETAIIIALFVAATIIIVGILVAKATQAANSVQTQ